MVNEHDRTVPVCHLQQRTHVLGVLLGEKAVSRHLRADHARQRQCALKLGGGGRHIGERQRSKHTEAPGVIPANPRQCIVDHPAQRQRNLDRLRLNPAERAEQRQHAGAHTLAIHPCEMKFHVVKRLGHRLLADPALHDFYAVLIAHDTRFLGAGAQGVDQLGGPPMGMHVDHDFLLGLSSNRLTSNVSVCVRFFPNYRAIYCNRYNEASAFLRHCCGPRSFFSLSASEFE